MTTTTFSDYTASITEIISREPDRWVGALVWFTIAGEVDYSTGKRAIVPVRVSHDELSSWFTDLGLNTGLLPPKIRKVDAFRTASSSITERYDLPIEGQFAELMVREVRYDADQVIRHVMREVRDTRGEKLSYDHVATLKFIRGGRTAQGKRPDGDHVRTQILHGLPALDREHVEALLVTFGARYTDLSENLQSQAIRGVVRSYLSHLNAIAVKPSGGVYFVPASQQTMLDALKTLIRRIGQGCTFEAFPLINSAESRDMLTEAFQTEVEDECRRLLGEIAATNERAQAKGGIEPKRYVELHTRLQEMMTRSQEYTQAIGLAQGRAGAALELAMNAVLDMASRIQVIGVKP